jgi:hypothetical protein
MTKVIRINFVNTKPSIHRLQDVEVLERISRMDHFQEERRQELINKAVQAFVELDIAQTESIGSVDVDDPDDQISLLEHKAEECLNELKPEEAETAMRAVGETLEDVVIDPHSWVSEDN